MNTGNNKPPGKRRRKKKKRKKIKNDIIVLPSNGLEHDKITIEVCVSNGI